MRVLLISRPPRRRAGGLVWSGNLTAEMLAQSGCVVDRRSIYEDLPADIPAPDAVYVYGEMDRVGQFLRVVGSVAPGCPVVVNSTVDGRKSRSRAMLEQLRLWRQVHRRTFLGVFTEWARAGLGGDAGVVVPQPFRCPDEAGQEWVGRTGVCFGELRKLVSARISGRDVQACVDAVRAALPMAPMLVYDQHGGRPVDLPGTTVLPYMAGADFIRFLGGLRLFISLARFETFAMVPLEAQACGTPVVYRSMPQSLDVYIGASGVRFSSPEDLAAQAKKLYHNAITWGRASAQGRSNARAKSPAAQAQALRSAFERLL